jgi:hypothetical protein
LRELRRPVTQRLPKRIEWSEAGTPAPDAPCLQGGVEQLCEAVVGGRRLGGAHGATAVDRLPVAVVLTTTSEWDQAVVVLYASVELGHEPIEAGANLLFHPDRPLGPATGPAPQPIASLRDRNGSESFG